MTAYIQWFLHQHQMELTEPLVEVKTAARLAQQLVYQNKVLPHAFSNLLSLALPEWLPWQLSPQNVRVAEALGSPPLQHRMLDLRQR